MKTLSLQPIVEAAYRMVLFRAETNVQLILIFAWACRHSNANESI